MYNRVEIKANVVLQSALISDKGELIMGGKIKLVIVWLILIACLFLLTGCSIESDNIQNNTIIENASNESTIDYINEETFEQYLNSEIDTKGKNVKFVVKDYKPNSALGCNSQAGEHLNFISKTDLQLKNNDEVIGKIISTKKFLGTWIIDYEVIKINPAVEANSNLQAENSNTVKEPENIANNKEEQKEVKKPSQENVKEQTTKETKTTTQTKKENTSNKNTKPNTQSSSTVKVPAGEKGSNLVWIPTNGGAKYHSRSGCSNMKNPKQVTKATAESSGYTPCKKCYK